MENGLVLVYGNQKFLRVTLVFTHSFYHLDQIKYFKIESIADETNAVNLELL